MRGELKARVASGVAWSIGEKIGTALLQMGVRIVILRLLLPDDLGVMAILTAFSTFALVVVDSGFSQTLIRKAEPTGADYKSVFVFNLAAAAAMYALMVGIAPMVARFYAMPVLARVAPVFFLVLPVNALCVIQFTIFTRQFRFALMSKVTFVASLAGGFVAILLALAGCGVWSIVVQPVVSMAVRALLLWWLSDWRPRAGGSFGALRAMAPFSLSLMTTDLIAALYNRIPQLFIGRMYAADTLGYFDQAQKLKDLPVTSTMTAVQGVTFPALSQLAGDGRKFAESYRQVVLVVVYAMFPMMLGMSAVAPDLFRALLGEKWMPTVPYFEAICLAGLFYPVAMVAYNVLKVKSTGGLLIRLEVLKKVILTLIFIVCIPRSVQAVVWGLVVFAFVEMAINTGFSLRFTELTLGRLLRSLWPVAAVAGTMYVAVRLTASFVPGGALLRLSLQIAVGIAVYWLLSAALRLEAYREIVGIVKRRLRSAA